MLLGGSVMRTEMHGSFTEHRDSRLAPPSARVGGDVMREVFNSFVCRLAQRSFLCNRLKQQFF